MPKKILIVGAGGLGCELTKLLAIDPTNEITIIDNDTIDSTNLNRQFYFTINDINKSKSEVISDKNKYKISIESINDNINNFKCISFYKQFEVVFNCLDNNKARSFVNQRCHLAGVQMIDGGSAGWLGQAFNNGKECFDCLPKKINKEYPICNIRQRPENFEHCLIWAERIIKDKDEESIKNEINKVEEIYISAVEEKEISKKEDLNFELDNKENNGSNESNGIKNSGILIETQENQSKKKSSEEEFIFIRKRLKKWNYGLEISYFFSKSEDENIYNLAELKALRFNINPMPIIESETFLKKIIPSICTTNSIIASLMILSYLNKKNYFLTQGYSMILNVDLNQKNRKCMTCGMPTLKCIANEQVSVNDLLKILESECIIDEEEIYYEYSNQLLNIFDGSFVIASIRGKYHRIYIEIRKESTPILVEKVLQ